MGCYTMLFMFNEDNNHFIFSRKSYVFLNSFSVSPGKPTIMSVVSITSLYVFLKRFTMFLNCSVVYLLFILFNVSSQPLCNDK